MGGAAGIAHAHFDTSDGTLIERLLRYTPADSHAGKHRDQGPYQKRRSAAAEGAARQRSPSQVIEGSYLDRLERTA
jgi:hypothetical protein